MIRFRYAEDEKRYLLLLGGLQRRFAIHLPPEQISAALRDLGALQDILLAEGIRQGVAAASIDALRVERDDRDSFESLKALQLHVAVYENHDTPLQAVEQGWLDRLGIGPGLLLAGVSDGPMEFAPAPALPVFETAPSTPPKSWDEWSDADIAKSATDWQRRRAHIDAGDASEQPAFLDRVRDTLIVLRDQGYKPGAWAEMILRLHIAMQVDAGFLDIQMSTPMGLTVLAQAGYLDMRPPHSLNQIEALKPLEPLDP